MGRKRRLLIIGPLPPPYAGPELGTEALVESSTLATHYQLRHLNTNVRKSNLNKGRIDIMMMTAFIIYLYRFLSVLVSFRPELVIYCPTSATLQAWVRDGITLFLGNLAGARIVLQFRGGHFRYFFDGLSRIPQAIVRWLLGRAALVLVQAERLKDQFRGLVPEDRIGRLHNSIADEFFDAFEGLDRRSHIGPLKILFVGHLTQAKGYCDVLKLVPRLAREFDVLFQFVGVRGKIERNVFFNQATGDRIVPESPHDVFEKFIAEPGLEDRIEFLGDRVFGAEKVRVFADADIFILPSYSEGFSRAILESMAAGLPALVTEVGAVPDILEDGVSAQIAVPGDIEAIYSKLRALLVSPELRKDMGDCARDVCRNELLEPKLSAGLVSMLETL